jgi:AcrR family transcriptional regulator
MMETKPVHTKDRILDVAERLFAEKGFAETSLRDITSAAGTNLAAVNYHFQSKDALLLAVFARRVGPVNDERLRRLDELEARAAGRPISIEDLIRAFMEPALRLLLLPSGTAGAQLVGRLFVEPGDLFERVYAQNIAAISNRLISALQRALPDIPPVELYWKFLFTAGVFSHTVGGFNKIETISGGRCDTSDIEGLIERLVVYIAAGFRAPVNPHQEGESPCHGPQS